MKLVDTIADPIFTFPIEAARFFPTHLNQILTHYRQLITAVDDEFRPIIQEHLPGITETCLNLLAATDAAFKGNIVHANNIFSQIINKLEPYLVYPDKNYVKMNPAHLFKARRVMDGQFGLTDMFHVPFEKRYEINTTRFSLPGVPCLYLSNSIYTCWEELERPAFAQMPVSRFELSGKNFKFLDFSNSNDLIKHSIVRRAYVPNPTITEEKEKEMFDETLELIRTFLLPRYLQAFPLMAACYIKVFNRKHHFKPEYIFPQMVMQWIMTQDDIDGISYLSTKSRPLGDDFFSFLQNFLNYAIPIRSFKETGYCDTMVNRIKLTEPLTFELFSIRNPVAATKTINYDKDIKNKFFPSPIHRVSLGEKIVPYMETTFGILEHELMKAPVKHLEIK